MDDAQERAIGRLERAFKACADVGLRFYAREKSILACDEATHQEILQAGSAEEFMSGDITGERIHWVDDHGTFMDSGA